MVVYESHKFVQYSEKDMKMLACALNMAEVQILANSDFSRHGHLQQTGVSWIKGHKQRYYTCV